jgi:hypothetical protein
MMSAKKPKLSPSARRRISQLEQELVEVEAQIARLEKDANLGLAQRDHFAFWKRAPLFARWPSDRLQ